MVFLLLEHIASYEFLPFCLLLLQCRICRIGPILLNSLQKEASFALYFTGFLFLEQMNFSDSTGLRGKILTH